MRCRRTIRFAVAAAFLLVAAGVLAWRAGVGPAELRAGWESLESWLAARPFWLVVALATLPGLPLPSSALLAAAGVVWRGNPAFGCAAAVLAMGLCQLWTYGFAAGPGRRLVGRMLAEGGYKLPQAPGGGHVRLVMVLRLTPGIPFFVQNYALGLLRVPLRVYVPVSLLCNAAWVCGLVLTGAGLGGGRIMPLLGGASVIVLALLLTHALRHWLRKKQAAESGGGPESPGPGGTRPAISEENSVPYE